MAFFQLFHNEIPSVLSICSPPPKILGTKKEESESCINLLVFCNNNSKAMWNLCLLFGFSYLYISFLLWIWGCIWQCSGPTPSSLVEILRRPWFSGMRSVSITELSLWPSSYLQLSGYFRVREKCLKRLESVTVLFRKCHNSISCSTHSFNSILISAPLTGGLCVASALPKPDDIYGCPSVEDGRSEGVDLESESMALPSIFRNHLLSPDSWSLGSCLSHQISHNPKAVKRE